MNRAHAVVVGVLLLLFASACRVDTTVDIKVEEDGSGLVTVSVDADTEAVELLVDDPSDLRFDDLEAAGWTLDGPETDDGGITLSASKPFLSPEDLPDVLDEIMGEELIFSNVVLDQQHDFSMFGLRAAETSYTFTADVDPNPDLELLGDEVLAGLLDGFPLGRSELRIATDAGAPLETSLGMVVNVTLPSNASTDTGEAVDDVATWSFAYGDAAQSIDARRRSTRSCPGSGPCSPSSPSSCSSSSCSAGWARSPSASCAPRRGVVGAISVSANDGRRRERPKPTDPGAGSSACWWSTCTVSSYGRPTRSTVCSCR